MNKQEAIEIVESRAFNIGDIDLACGLSHTKHIINQIDEPQKVVVPKFVAEWIEECKGRGCPLRAAMKHINLPDKVNAWFLETGQDEFTYPNQDIFARAWLDGFDIEQEKLYTVEIADAILTKITRGRIVQYRMLPFKDVSDVFDNAIYYSTRLTEKEIIGADKRLWQFAKEVE